MEYADHLKIAAAALRKSPEELQSALEVAARSDSRDHCIDWRDWESYPGLDTTARNHAEKLDKDFLTRWKKVCD